MKKKLEPIKDWIKEKEEELDGFKIEKVFEDNGKIFLLYSYLEQMT
jgi:hypothetical protein